MVTEIPDTNRTSLGLYVDPREAYDDGLCFRFGQHADFRQHARMGLVLEHDVGCKGASGNPIGRIFRGARDLVMRIEAPGVGADRHVAPPPLPAAARIASVIG